MKNITITDGGPFTDTWSTDLTTPFSTENMTCYDTFVDCANSSSTYTELSSASLISSVLSNLSLAVLLTNLHLLTNQTSDAFNSSFFENNTLFQQLGLRGYNFTSPALMNITLASIFASNSSLNFTEIYDQLNFTFDPDMYNNFNDSDQISTGLSLKDYLENLNFTSSLENGTQFNDSSTMNSNATWTDLSTDSNYNFSESTTEFWTDIPTLISKIINDTLDNTTDFDNTTIDIFTTLMPYINITDLPPDISSYFSEIQTTVSSYLQNITSTTKASKCLVRKCDVIDTKSMDTSLVKPTKKSVRKTGQTYDYALRKQLRNLCWETLFGQELVKLTVMDLCMTIFSIMTVDFFRSVFVRVMNRCWCWDLEKKFPQYGDFKIAEHILSLVNNQGMVWMGMFFSPGITVINLIKLAIIMYLQSWVVLTCNIPHEVVFKASRSNNFYLALLLTMLFLCVLPVGYAIVWVRPSWHCGPFSEYERIYHIFTTNLKKVLPKSMNQALDYIASPFIVIPLLVLLILIIYYMISLTNALREANNDLKVS